MRICEICRRTSSASLFCRRVENDPPTDCTDLHRFTGAWEVPQNTQNSQNSKNTTSVCICEICGRTSSASLFCEFCEFCGRTSSASLFCEFCEFCGRTPSASLFCEFCEFCGRTSLPVCSVNSEFCGRTSLPVCSVNSVKSVGEQIFPRNTQNTQNNLLGWCSRDCCTPWKKTRL